MDNLFNNSYVNINVNDFDINKLNLYKENLKIKDEVQYYLKYNDKYFYMETNKAFNSYGIKSKFNKKIENEYDYETNYEDTPKKVSIIINDNNSYHKKYKEIINLIYNKVDNYCKNNNLKLYNPISVNYNAINLEINNKSILYLYNKQSIELTILKNIIKFNHVPFKIAPTIYFKPFIKKDNILYFNICIRTAIIQFEVFHPNLDKVSNLFSYNMEYEDKKSNKENNKLF